MIAFTILVAKASQKVNKVKNNINISSSHEVIFIWIFSSNAQPMSASANRAQKAQNILIGVKKSNPKDTVMVQMQDRLCLQFRMKVRDMGALPQVEEALLATLNADPAMQVSYQTYIANLREEVAFNHRQAVKLDSLTSAYYFNNPAISMADAKASSNGVTFYGDRRIRLFLNEIYAQQQHMQRIDYRLQLATAPVVLENHFAVDSKPVHSRRQIMICFFLLAWIGGCLIAEIIDKRKAISAWLKQ